MSVSSARRILVPVGDTVTMRNTVAYVVREGVGGTDAAGVDNGDGERELHFVFPVTWQNRDLNADAADSADALLDRVRAWIREDLGLDDDEKLPIQVTTAVIGADEFLFSPRDYAEALCEYARDHELEHVVLDPEYRPGSRTALLEPLAVELVRLGEVTQEEAPVERAVRGRRLLDRTADAGAVATVFGLCFLFYQVLGGFAGTFDYVTGALSAGIAAAVFSGITFDQGVSPPHALRATARSALFVPYLFWEIAKANLGVAYVVLSPSMPIDPSVERFRPALPVGLPAASLANSITLTPGTVTVEVRDGQFHVHALTGSARDGLFEGGLERAVRFVFFGRDAARIPSPRDRGQTRADGAGNARAGTDEADPDPGEGQSPGGDGS
jgi:multicomponent Na+:H+ antiporter subunit E